MFHFLLGPEGFQRGVEAFFNNNDGKVRQPWPAVNTPQLQPSAHVSCHSSALENKYLQLLLLQQSCPQSLQCAHFAN
jgi:hypothetical protein